MCGFNAYSRTSATVHHSDESTAAARDNPVHLRGQMLAVGGPVPIGHRGSEIDLEVVEMQPRLAGNAGLL